MQVFSNPTGAARRDYAGTQNQWGQNEPISALEWAHINVAASPGQPAFWNEAAIAHSVRESGRRDASADGAGTDESHVRVNDANPESLLDGYVPRHLPRPPIDEHIELDSPEFAFASWTRAPGRRRIRFPGIGGWGREDGWVNPFPPHPKPPWPTPDEPGGGAITGMMSMREIANRWRLKEAIRILEMLDSMLRRLLQPFIDFDPKKVDFVALNTGSTSRHYSPIWWSSAYLYVELWPTLERLRRIQSNKGEPDEDLIARLYSEVLNLYEKHDLPWS